MRAATFCSGLGPALSIAGSRLLANGHRLDGDPEEDWLIVADDIKLGVPSHRAVRSRLRVASCPPNDINDFRRRRASQIHVNYVSFLRCR